MTGGDPEQLLHLVQLDVRDAGLQQLDVRPLWRLELLRCDRNSLGLLRASGHALKSLHASHNGSSPTHVCVCCVKAILVCVCVCVTPAPGVLAELKLLEVQPVPEALTHADLSW